jgi:uncharacterized membrane protein HdeD (DUF308 family)
LRFNLKQSRFSAGAIRTEASMTNQPLDAVRPAGTARDHCKLYLGEGIVLVALGLAAAFVPARVGTILFAWLFLISGMAGLVTTLVVRHAPGFWWSLLSAVLAMAVAAMLFAQPELGMVTLTLVLIVFLVLEGIVTIMFALEHRRELSGRWGWMLASGIVDLLLAAAILLGLPGTADWAMGLIVGVNLLFGGVALIGMALAARPRIA